MRKTIRAAATMLPLFAALAGPGSVAAQTTKPLSQALIGHWSLVSVDIGGAHPLGAKPQGSMFFDAAGNYSVIVIGEGAANGISYFGEYTVDDATGALTMHIDAGSRPGAAGRDEKRRDHAQLATRELDPATISAQGRPPPLCRSRSPDAAAKRIGGVGA